MLDLISFEKGEKYLQSLKQKAVKVFNFNTHLFFLDWHERKSGTLKTPKILIRSRAWFSVMHTIIYYSEHFFWHKKWFTVQNLRLIN